DVTFTFYTSSNCTTGGSGAGTVNVVSGVAHPSSSEGPLAAGSYSFSAHYNGDSNYNPSDSACEPLTIGKANSSTSTDIHNAAHQIITSAALGSTVHDSASVSGSPFTPTGGVRFTFFTSGDCTTGGTNLPGGLLSGGSFDNTAQAQGPLAAGSYSFQARYSGDSNYNPSTSDCEPLTINKANTSTSTDIHNAAHQIITSAALGSTVHDSASVTSSNNSFTIGADVTFTFYTSSDCTTGGSGAGTVNVVSGVAHPSSSEGPLVAGSYSFSAHYTGSSNSTPSDSASLPLPDALPISSTSTDIHNAAHQVITSAALGSTVHDSASVSGSPFTPTGGVRFTFFTSNDCTTGGSNDGGGLLSGGSFDNTANPGGPLARGGAPVQAPPNGAPPSHPAT